MEAGLTPSDIHNIEYLEDREVLERLPGGFRWLKRNERADVIVYLETMADILEEKLHEENMSLLNVSKPVDNIDISLYIPKEDKVLA